ncbi:unnamed protein product [Pleuronectes platessa]|uniref:Uncharacterized protein n=1 Tax=Pleuronectes platessa TaxID=8262 RepID=A0A9N7YXZ3_PLEPL|nr:unnamed protein product [Pleuronectes platessa]
MEWLGDSLAFTSARADRAQVELWDPGATTGLYSVSTGASLQANNHIETWGLEEVGGGVGSQSQSWDRCLVTTFMTGVVQLERCHSSTVCGVSAALSVTALTRGSSPLLRQRSPEATHHIQLLWHTDVTGPHLAAPTSICRRHEPHVPPLTPPLTDTLYGSLFSEITKAFRCTFCHKRPVMPPACDSASSASKLCKTQGKLPQRDATLLFPLASSSSSSLSLFSLSLNVTNQSVYLSTGRALWECSLKPIQCPPLPDPCLFYVKVSSLCQARSVKDKPRNLATGPAFLSPGELLFLSPRLDAFKPILIVVMTGLKETDILFKVTSVSTGVIQNVGVLELRNVTGLPGPGEGGEVISQTLSASSEPAAHFVTRL